MLGRSARAFHDEYVRGVKACKIQCDEIWSFNYCKQKNVATAKAAPEMAWRHLDLDALDSQSKLLVSWLVGDRTGATAIELMDDLPVPAGEPGATYDRWSLRLSRSGRRRVRWRCGLCHAGKNLWRVTRSRKACTARPNVSARARTRLKAAPIRSTSARRTLNGTICRNAPLCGASPGSHWASQEGAKSRPHGRALCRLVQFREAPQGAQNDACDGRWHFQKSLVDG